LHEVKIKCKQYIISSFKPSLHNDENMEQMGWALYSPLQWTIGKSHAFE